LHFPNTRVKRGEPQSFVSGGLSKKDKPQRRIPNAKSPFNRAQRVMMKKHHLAHLLAQTRLWIRDQFCQFVASWRREGGICRFHIFASTRHKMFLSKWKASNRVKTMKKFVPHFAVEDQC